MKKILLIISVLLLLISCVVPSLAAEDTEYENAIIYILPNIRVNSSFKYTVSDTTYTTFVIKRANTSTGPANNFASLVSTSNTRYWGWADSLYTSASTSNKFDNAGSGSTSLGSLLSTTIGSKPGLYFYLSIKSSDVNAVKNQLRASYETNDLSKVLPVGERAIPAIVKNTESALSAFALGSATYIAALPQQVWFNDFLIVFGVTVAIAVAFVVIRSIIRRFKYV